MAENTKNVDRFFKTYRIKTIASDTSNEFTGITATGSTSSVDVSDAPMSIWSLQVKGVGASPTLWEVNLEGSLDGVNFSTILSHTTLIGDGINLFSGTTLFLAKYYRITVAVLTLGPATSITASVIGRQ